MRNIGALPHDERILQQLEMRDAFFVERHEFAVDYGVAPCAFERLRHFDIAVTNNLAVAAVQGDLASLDFRDHAEAVKLVLEDPSFVVEWRIRQCREHRLQALRKGGYPAHGQGPFENVAEGDGIARLHDCRNALPPLGTPAVAQEIVFTKRIPTP